ncbi:DUF6913 domain-containing protein [Constantimarinum furrinae]|uniref:Uncharacterized protein n=1 Tax=Constantimarinum furrinae TaxID=2562285 RepID=A0A7G8PY21_9FLAO|nr:hypothetical protein [Constantimarinum furrinae]QNJ99237.1 hypothetical protein ALE3EI_2710 [Constantimarinum furrinae]
MFKNLRHKSLQKRTDKNLKIRDVSQVNAPLKTLGFIVDEKLTTDFEFLYEYWRELGIQRKDVKVFSFVEVKKKLPTLQQNQIQNKEFTWKGEIHNQNAREFLDVPFDVLVGYYHGTNKFLDLMVTESKAKFKVGAANADDRLYDLLINITLDKEDAFKSEFVKYMKILGKIG